MRSPQIAILGLTRGEDNSERIGRIERHARRTLALADSFVELARLTEARLEPQDVELSALLGECADNAWPEAKARKARIDRPDDPECEAWTHADPLVLARAADNLIGNALRYGGEAVTVTLRAGCSPDSHEVWFSVADNGPGLPEGRASDPFVRFGARGETQEPGSGLGLAFVKAAIERSGGRIEWKSAPGKGTSFTAYLPAA
jgi:signal transduction histidine kinase